MEQVESALDYHVALAMLDWQLELGVDETLYEAPINRNDLQQAQPKPAAAAGPDGKRRAPAPVAKPKVDPPAEARAAAATANDLPSLRAALETFPHCELKQGARSLVFGDGLAGARVMIVGEAPNREEDRAGKPYVGPQGTLLDKMLAAIDLDRGSQDRDSGVYITTVLPWRGPTNRDASPAEIAMMKPFLERHIQLAKPDVLVLMGNLPCQALLAKRGISRLRGQWGEALGIPALPMLEPQRLLRNPAAKRDTWADLLALRAHLNG
ncbi:DNA polymerase [Thalassovita mediterranea]|nr:DNA polymerase [Thalassovita mediterranea]